MPSPFPGMDPYLERHWRDVHSRLVVYATECLQPHLPRGLKARVEERVYIEPAQGEGRDLNPISMLLNVPGWREQSAAVAQAELRSLLLPRNRS